MPRSRPISFLSAVMKPGHHGNPNSLWQESSLVVEAGRHDWLNVRFCKSDWRKKKTSVGSSPDGRVINIKDSGGIPFHNMWRRCITGFFFLNATDTSRPPLNPIAILKFLFALEKSFSWLFHCLISSSALMEQFFLFFFRGILNKIFPPPVLSELLNTL